MRYQEIEMIEEIPLTACVPGVPKGMRGVIVSGPDYNPPPGKLAIEFDATILIDGDLDDDEKTIVIYVPINFCKPVEAK